MVCDRVAILDKGVLKGIGTVDQLVAHQPQAMKVRVAGCWAGGRRAGGHVGWPRTPNQDDSDPT